MTYNLNLDLGGPDSWAVISEDTLYRYRLGRCWDRDDGTVCWIMLNPSTADHRDDDATIRKCMGFTRRWGYGAIDVVNLFAYRTRSPRVLRAAAVAGKDVIGGQRADEEMVAAFRGADLIVSAWGAGWSNGPGARVVRVCGLALDATRAGAAGGNHVTLGLTSDGAPRHPLMLSYDTVRVPVRPGAGTGRPGA